MTKVKIEWELNSITEERDRKKITDWTPIPSEVISNNIDSIQILRYSENE